MKSTKKKHAAPAAPAAPPVVGLVLGSGSDWETMKTAAETLKEFGIPYEKKVASAHRTPDAAVEYAKTADARGLKVIIAAAGGAAHLAGVLAAHTELPVLGVPMKGWALEGLDSLLSTVQMPAGIPVLTLAVGKAGAANAALGAAAILALSDQRVKDRLHQFRQVQSKRVLETKLPD